MPAIFELDQYGTLPLWAQVLIAARMVRRGTLAMLAEGSARQTILDACDAMERCARQGEGTRREQKPLDAAKALREHPPREAPAIAESVWWAIDATRAAEAAQDFPIDATVTNSALNAIRSLSLDRRVLPLQLSILVAGDLDLVRFSCGEARIGRYDGLTNYVFERLTPTHAIDLGEPRRSPEEDAR